LGENEMRDTLFSCARAFMVAAADPTSLSGNVHKTFAFV
jgi:hypothetical protein